MKKSLGQNFLRDPKILRRIVDFAHIEKGDTVVEIGPGEGTLTQILLDQIGDKDKLISIEKDADLVKMLKAKFEKEILDNRFEIIEGDILSYKLNVKSYKLIGNIPYYITGAIFKKFLESENPPREITFVIQKEVAERIMARDNKESVLSISIKAYGEPEYGGIIKAGSFSPAPKVDSAIISIRNISKKRFFERDFRRLTNREQEISSRKLSVSSEKNFFLLLKKGFAHKRKLLIKNLGVDKEIFEKLKIPINARAEDLSIDDWFGILRECREEKSSQFSS